MSDGTSLACDGGTHLEHLTHNLKIVGSNPTAGIRIK